MSKHPKPKPVRESTRLQGYGRTDYLPPLNPNEVYEIEPRVVMTAPGRRPTDPTQLPDLREKLLKHWQSSEWFVASRFAHTGALTYSLPPEFENLGVDQHAMNACATESKLLRDASLWWVGEEMCDLLYSTLDEMPADVTFDHLVLPSAHGFVMLEKEWSTAIDANLPDHFIKVDVFVWGRTRLHPIDSIPGGGGTHCLSMSCYRFVDARNLAERGLAAAWGSPQGASCWVPIGRSDWPVVLPLGDPLPVNDDAFEDELARAAFIESTIQDRRLMAAFFALLESPLITHIEERGHSRQVKKQALRKGKPEPAPVKVIYLRKPKHHNPEGEGTGGKLTKRFMVRAHPVNQPYGPGHSKRKLIMRGPFLKGPDGAEFMPPRHEVHAWVK